MKTPDEILREYEDKKEYHFHRVDREWIIEAMQEYADQFSSQLEPLGCASEVLGGERREKK